MAFHQTSQYQNHLYLNTFCYHYEQNSTIITDFPKMLAVQLTIPI